jgi:RNA polymerase sigma-70 factor (ECF subfamily)
LAVRDRNVAAVSPGHATAIIRRIVSRKTSRSAESSTESRSSADNFDTSSESTSEILARARGGDRSAARVLIARALPALRRWSHGRIPKYGRGPADTEDFVQDAVLRMLKRLKTFEHRTVGALQAYMRTAVVNSIRDVVRRVGRRGVPSELPEDLADTAHTPLEQAVLQQKLDRFVEALQQLRPADRQVIVWRIELGYSYDEIGHRLGKTTTAARAMVMRALGRLTKALGIEPEPSSRER